MFCPFDPSCFVCRTLPFARMCKLYVSWSRSDRGFRPSGEVAPVRASHLDRSKHNWRLSCCHSRRFDSVRARTRDAASRKPMLNASGHIRFASSFETPRWIVFTDPAAEVDFQTRPFDWRFVLHERHMYYRLSLPGSVSRDRHRADSFQDVT